LTLKHSPIDSIHHLGDQQLLATAATIPQDEYLKDRGISAVPIRKNDLAQRRRDAETHRRTDPDSNNNLTGSNWKIFGSIDKYWPNSSAALRLCAIKLLEI
jgi:hypothetical protein